MAELSREELRETPQLTAQIQELQDKINSMNDSRAFQHAESVRSSRLGNVPMQPNKFSSHCGASDRTHEIYLGISGDDFGSSAATM